MKESFAADLVLVSPDICENPVLLLDYSPEVSVTGEREEREERGRGECCVLCAVCCVLCAE